MVTVAKSFPPKYQPRDYTANRKPQYVVKTAREENRQGWQAMNIFKTAAQNVKYGCWSNSVRYVSFNYELQKVCLLQQISATYLLLKLASERKITIFV